MILNKYFLEEKRCSNPHSTPPNNITTHCHKYSTQQTADLMGSLVPFPFAHMSRHSHCR